MTDAAMTPAERVAALRARRTGEATARPGRQRPAQAAKILTAGLASTAVLTLTAVYGWTARAEDTSGGAGDGGASPLGSAAVVPMPTAAVASLVLVDPATGRVLGAVDAAAAPAVIDAATGESIPGAVAPELPTVAQQVLVPVAVPAAVAVPAGAQGTTSGTAASTTQASSSGS